MPSSPSPSSSLRRRRGGGGGATVATATSSGNNDDDKKELRDLQQSPAANDENKDRGGGNTADGDSDHSSDPLLIDCPPSHHNDDHDDNDDDPHSEEKKKKKEEHPKTSTIITTATATTTTTRRTTTTTTSSPWVVRFLQGYTKFMSSSVHLDQSLKLLQWTLWLASRLAQVRRRTRKREQQPPAGNGDLSPLLKKLSYDVSWARYVTRLFGLPVSAEAVLTDSWVSSSARHHAALFRFLGRIMAWSMVGYYPTEHAAFVQWKAAPKQTPTPSSPTKEKKKRFAVPSAETLSAWSCRFWGAYIVAEMVQGVLQWRELVYQIRQQQQQEHQQGRRQGAEEDQEEHARQQKQLKVQLRNVKLQLTRNALFFFPCIHWSLPHWDTDPWLSEDVTNGLMWLESVVCMIQSVSNN